MAHRPGHERGHRRPPPHQGAQEGQRGPRAAQVVRLLDDAVLDGEALAEAEGGHARVGDAVGHAQVGHHRPQQVLRPGEQTGEQEQGQGRPELAPQPRPGEHLVALEVRAEHVGDDGGGPHPLNGGGQGQERADERGEGQDGGGQERTAPQIRQDEEDEGRPERPQCRGRGGHNGDGDDDRHDRREG